MSFKRSDDAIPIVTNDSSGDTRFGIRQSTRRYRMVHCLNGGELLKTRYEYGDDMADVENGWADSTETMKAPENNE